MALTDALKAKLNRMCPGAAAALLGDELATDGIIAAAISYFTENPSAMVDLLASLIDYLHDNDAERADILYKLAEYAGGHSTQVEGLVHKVVEALGDVGHLYFHNAGFTMTQAKVVIQFTHGGTTYSLPLYASAVPG